MEEFQIFLVHKTAQKTENGASVYSNGCSRNTIQYGGILVLIHLAKIKVDFLATKWPVFIIVINTSLSGIMAGFTPAKYSFNNVLAPNGALALFRIFCGRKSCHNARQWGISSYNNVEGTGKFLFANIAQLQLHLLSMTLIMEWSLSINIQLIV